MLLSDEMAVFLIDINECLDGTCGENAKCVNTEGNYTCECDPGFTGDGYSCTGV